MYSNGYGYNPYNCGQPCPPRCQGSITIGQTITGEPGTKAQVYNSGTNCDAILNFTIPRGASGPTGAAGPRGITGAAGPTGAVGATGATGLRGTTGATGATGLRGATGATGVTGATGLRGATGATGATGADGSGSSIECLCIEQMRNILRQLAVFYPDEIVSVTLDNGDKYEGLLGSLYPEENTSQNAALLVLHSCCGNQTEVFPICHITSVSILSGSTYNDEITYLSAPVPYPSGCSADCQRAIREYFPVGTSYAATQGGQGTVIRNEFGMLVLAGCVNNSLTFISICRESAYSI